MSLNATPAPAQKPNWIAYNYKHPYEHVRSVFAFGTDQQYTHDGGKTWETMRPDGIRAKDHIEGTEKQALVVAFEAWHATQVKHVYTYGSKRSAVIELHDGTRHGTYNNGETWRGDGDGWRKPDDGVCPCHHYTGTERDTFVTAFEVWRDKDKDIYTYVFPNVRDEPKLEHKGVAYYRDSLEGWKPSAFMRTHTNVVQITGQERLDLIASWKAWRAEQDKARKMPPSQPCIMCGRMSHWTNTEIKTNIFSRRTITYQCPAHGKWYHGDGVNSMDLTKYPPDIRPQRAYDLYAMSTVSAATSMHTISSADATSKPTNPKDILGSDKIPLHLWPETATLHGALALQDGALKYGRANWRAVGVKASIYYDACRRHLNEWFEGSDKDKDSGLHPLAHALACIAIIIDATEADMLTDDRQYPGGYTDAVARLTPQVKAIKAKHVAAGHNPKHYTIFNPHS